MATTDDESTVEFQQAYPPPLEAGTYQVTATQTLTSVPGSPTYTATGRFLVSGPRFTLDPTLIHSFYPPPNHQGDFSKYLPQIVFTRKTLPWERSLDGDPPNPKTVSAIQVTAGGSGYPPTTTVKLTSSDGNQSATASAVVNGGAVIGVAVTCPGWNYSSAPTVAFSGGTGAAATATLGEVYIPWLGILLFNENDPGWPLPVQPATVGQLIAQENGGTREPNVLGPALTASDVTKEGQLLTDPLLVIDVPVSLFSTIAPTLGDLALAAHARHIDPSKKVYPAAHNDDGWISVVIGNRFPEPGFKNQAYLVSFEKFATSQANYLNGAPLPSQYTKVRLVCLASWQFMNQAETSGENFQQLMQGLDIGRLSLTPKTAATSGPGLDVQNNLLAGYTALNHTTRQGEKTASWNRGPLVPLNLEPSATLPTTYHSADAALEYNPATGLFDVSYAAAWQMGRLLGLNNRQFSMALFRWRRAAHQNAVTALTRKLLHARLSPAICVAGPPGDPVPRFVVKDRIMGFLTNVVVPRLQASGSTKGDAPLLGDPADPSGLREFVGRLGGLLPAAELTRILNSTDDPIKAIHDWLQR